MTPLETALTSGLAVSIGGLITLFFVCLSLKLESVSRDAWIEHLKKKCESLQVAITTASETARKEDSRLQSSIERLNGIIGGIVGRDMAMRRDIADAVRIDDAEDDADG